MFTVLYTIKDNMKKVLYFGFLIATIALTSCSKKDKANNANNNTNTPTNVGSTLDLIKDSVFLYSKEAYYWYDGLPSYTDFNPRSFSGSADLDALHAEINAISQYKIDPATGKPFEYYTASPGKSKYSFIDEGQVSTQLNGTNSNFGFAPFYNDVNDLRIKYIYPGSPADLAGIKRGYKILSINGNSSLSYDGGGTNTQFVINAYTSTGSITMKLQKADLSTVDVTLNATSYTANPVLTYKAINTGNGKIVGYIVFNSFTADANADPKLDEAFNYFQTQGITDLVVDIRYNGGGFTSTAEYLSNLIVPASKTGSPMYSYYFNDILVNNRETLLTNQVRRNSSTNQLYNYGQFNYTVAGNTVKFAKKGSLNISRVFFIVSGATASASELTINNLRPHLDVQLIGGTTYGKPVGFFDIDINKYQLYIPEFETKNSLGQGGYYTGMTPGSATYPGIKDYDDVTKDFGDTTETLLHHAINYVKKGVYSVPTTRIQGLSGNLKTFSVDQANEAGIAINGNQFNGMIFNGNLKRK
jgi:carboxyl-terminal processing protease